MPVGLDTLRDKNTSNGTQVKENKNKTDVKHRTDVSWIPLASLFMGVGREQRLLVNGQTLAVIVPSPGNTKVFSLLKPSAVDMKKNSVSKSRAKKHDIPVRTVPA